MRNKFFFGVVVGFFVALVAFVVFFFFSKSVRAAAVTDPSVAVIRGVHNVTVSDDVAEDIVPVATVQSVSQVSTVRDIYLVDVVDPVPVRIGVIDPVPHKVLVPDIVPAVGGVTEAVEV